MTETVRTKRPVQAGHICFHCQEAIAVTEMLILTLSASWSIQDFDLPQLTGQRKFHPACAQAFIVAWKKEYALG